MIAARGTIQSNSGYKIIIDIPFSHIQTDDVSEKHDLLISLNRIRDRIGELSEYPPDVLDIENHASIVYNFRKKNLLWRDINMLFQGASDFREFRIPDQIFDAPTSIKKEFVSGFADVNGKVRKSNQYYGEIHRIYLDILNDNWVLPIQLCKLIQKGLRIPIQTLTWGHPNLRNRPDEPWSKREHQVKVFCEDFLPIGFYIKHKQEALEKLAKENKKKNHKSSLCIPPRRHGKKNPRHPDEKHEDLPIEIRGKHYDNYWMICKDLGCYMWESQSEFKESE